MRYVNVLLFLWCFKNTIFNLLTGTNLQSFYFLSGLCLCQMFFKKAIWQMYETTHLKNLKGFRIVSDNYVSYWSNGQLQTFRGTWCCLLLYQLCLSMSKTRLLRKDSCVSLNIPCSYNRRFSSKAEPTSIAGFIEKMCGKKRSLTLCMH